jgi:diguanylate cyclase (GGDEF)-like protein
MTLMDQMRITSLEIERRKELFDIRAEDGQRLQYMQAGMEMHMDEIIDDFYARQTGMPEISLIIGDNETLRRLKVSMRSYLRDLFSGVYDENYVEGRLRVGKVHKRIGVTPKLYMSAMCMLQGILEIYIDRLRPGDGQAEKNALHKMLLFDSQLVFETYISSLMAEIEAGKQQVERYAQGLEERVLERTQQLETLSKTDSITGLLNQRAMWDILRRDIALAKRSHSTFSVLYFDLNDFKRANDWFGHQIGDRILAQVGSAIRASIREVDAACRYGGDEFCIVMPGLILEDIEKIALRLIRAVGSYEQFIIYFSMGAAQWTEQLDAQTIIEQADSSMYAAKAASRDHPGHWLSSGDMPRRLMPPPRPVTQQTEAPVARRDKNQPAVSSSDPARSVPRRQSP